ncbi:MAG: roadblock/LC7 domain-containing protein [Promethearchaeota archaeon]
MKPDPKPASTTSIPFSSSTQNIHEAKPDTAPVHDRGKNQDDEFTDQPSPFAPSSRGAGTKPTITFKAIDANPKEREKPALIPMQNVKISAPARGKPGEKSGGKRINPSMVKINQPARGKGNGDNLSSLSNLVKKGKREEMVRISPKPSEKKKSQLKVTIPSIGIPNGSGVKAGTRGNAMVSIPSQKSPSMGSRASSSPASSPSRNKSSISASSLESSMKSDIELFKSTVRAMKKTPSKPETKAGKKELKQVSLTKDPQSLNDILKDLVKIDPYIKVSALVKRDGTILASAISTQVSDDLIVVIATTVSNIAKDIVFATSTGELKYISIAGTEGVTHLVPIVADIYLVILSGSGSKRGVIEVIARHVEKMTKQYLNV